ncbi:hypothetical protein OG302_40345 [Streptomyces sp. NBC_01283]|nr:hypothetical protein OG302_40345 [Streptomyces sp. NBC_01283]
MLLAAISTRIARHLVPAPATRALTLGAADATDDLVELVAGALPW